MKIRIPTIENYRMIEEVGCGADGVVWKAYNEYTGEVVAIKKLFEKNYDSIRKFVNLREIKSLDRLSNHPNIIKLKEAIREKNIVYLIFEYMECNLHKCILEPFSETEIRNSCFQLFQGLDYIHSNNYVHGGIKPSNLLVSGDTIKIGDLGRAREMNGELPYTGHVTTLWYQAPEMLLCLPMYNDAVDMWAMGAIMMELFINRPLFKGSSTANVMNKICEVLGSPTETTWPMGLDLADESNYQFPQHFGWKISELVPYASSEAINLIDSLLSWDPDKRPTAKEVLQHPFFDSCYIDQPFDSERVEDFYEDTICLLPDNLYDFEINEERSVKSCTLDTERAYDSKEDPTDHILREYQNETEIKKESESILTNRFFGSDWFDARFKTIYKSKITLLICLLILIASYATSTKYFVQ